MKLEEVLKSSPKRIWTLEKNNQCKNMHLYSCHLKMSSALIEKHCFYHCHENLKTDFFCLKIRHLPFIGFQWTLRVSLTILRIDVLQIVERLTFSGFFSSSRSGRKLPVVVDLTCVSTNNQPPYRFTICQCLRLSKSWGNYHVPEVQLCLWKKVPLLDLCW